MWSTCATLGAVLIAAAPVTSLKGQSPHTAPTEPPGAVLPTSSTSDRLRLRQLAGDTATLASYVLRSSSDLFRPAAPSRGTQIRWLLPDALIVVNSAVPFSENDGAMWAGRGVSVRLGGGVDLRLGRLHLVAAPELWASANARFDFTRDPNRFYTPPVPVPRYGNGFANPWYGQPYSADLPWRLGSSALGRAWFGQTGLWYNTGPLEFGATTENMWWGPGIRNAIVMSDNAAGVPRLELRTPRPWRTRLGSFEGRWFVGALSESQYFDTTKTDDVRSIAAAAVTWQPVFQPTLAVGVTRAVYAAVSGYGAVPLRWLDVFANTGQPANRLPRDSSLTPGGRDQLFSLFARWVFPDDGFEAYSEWARQELPRSLHDFLVDPSHSQGYTLGVQYRKPAPVDASTFRVQAEVTTLEQSGDFKNRPVGVFYTSRRVIQGYTEFGQPIGAAIGPGASSQWLAIDRVWGAGSYGLTFNRIRWNEDVRSTHTWPAYLGWCNHDVSLLPGVRGSHSVPGGFLAVALTTGTRLNYNFQNASGCHGPAKIDVHNTTVSLSFSPVTW